MHSLKQKKIKFHALKHVFSFKPEIHIQSNFYAFINAFFKQYKKKLNFTYSNMHFHSNSKFRFNKKFHSFINAPLKKRTKNQISCIQTCIFKIHIQLKNFMHS